jgi:hypothetical protein
LIRDILRLTLKEDDIQPRKVRTVIDSRSKPVDFVIHLAMKHLYPLVLGLLAHGARAQVSTLSRPLDPVVLSGASLPAFTGLSPGRIVGFRFGSGGWQQVPVQVDERALLDIVTPYGPLAAGSGYPPSPANLRVLFYTDASTYTGADPAPGFDADDELVFMAKDAGGRAPGSALPAGVVAGSGREVAVTDPLGGLGYVYLFENAGSLTQSAGASYVSYTSNLTTTSGFPANISGTNAENTTISTARYRWHFSSEWVSDELTLVVGSNTDILDRYKSFFANGSCIRHEDAFSAAENAFVTVKAGPLRVIRSYLGAVSGPLTQRTHLFYEGRHDIINDLRVHNIPSIQDAFDYAPAAAGMSYRNSLNLAGVSIDGLPDAVTLGDISWEQVSGTPGTLSILHGRSTTLTAADASIGSYYDDNRAAPASNCTGDGQAWGTSGLSVQFNGSICTDPIAFSGCGLASAAYRTLQTTRTLYVDPATAVPTTAAAYHQQRNNPLQLAVAAWPTATALAPGTSPVGISVYPNPGAGRVVVDVYQSGQLQIYNSLGQLVLAKPLRPGSQELVIGASGLLLFRFSTGRERTIIRQLMR